MADLPIPPSEAEPLDEAEELLLAALSQEGQLDAPGLERLCTAHPDLSERLRAAHAGLLALRALLRKPDHGRPPPERIAGRYRLLGELGRGGMSVVLSAFDEGLRRKVALKTVLVQGATSSATRAAARRRARLSAEAQVLAQLEHPGIVPVYDTVRDEHGELFVAMQRVRGVDLREVYRRHRSGDPDWSLPRVVGILQRACEAVAYAHERGVLHRDLKPANVMVGAFGETFVMDWGLARTGAREERGEPLSPADTGEAHGDAVAPAPDPDASLSVVVTDREDPASGSAEALLTQEGDVLGTPSYIAPEQAAGQHDAVDARSDVYGAGAMLYELLAGRAPYVRSGETRSSSQILDAVRASSPEPLDVLARRAPAELVAIAEKAMARDREQRYATMRELADDLRAYLEGRVVRAHRVGAWIEARKWVARHRAVVAVLSVLLLTVVAAGITFALLYRESENRRERLQAAQLDSQRRINALAGFSNAGRPAQSFVDEFEGSQLHRRWICTAGCDQVSVRDGELVLRSPERAKHQTTVELDPHVGFVSGDFDVQVAFRLEGFDLPDVPRGGRIACLQVVDLQGGTILSAIHREVEREPTPPAQWEQSYRSYDSATAAGFFRPEHCAPAEGRSGVFRVARAGRECTAWYYQDGWRELFRAEATDNPVSIVLTARNWYADEPFEFVIERVELTADPGSAVAEIGVLRDEFASSSLDPRFAVSSRAAIAAQVDGRLYLETLGGMEGRVEFGLDRTRWRLAADFELEIDYDLESFSPGPGPRPSAVRWQAKSLDGMNFASITFEATAEGRRVVGWTNREERHIALERERGRLRIERAGTTLRLAIEGPSGWQVLVERPHVDASIDFGFSLIVESPAESGGVVASFDNLRVSSLSQR